MQTSTLARSESSTRFASPIRGLVLVAIWVSSSVASVAKAQPTCREAVEGALHAEVVGSVFLAEGDHHTFALPELSDCVGVLAVGAPSQRVGLEAIDAEGESVGGDRGGGGFAWVRACRGWHLRLHGLSGAGEVSWAVTGAEAASAELRRSPPDSCGPFAGPAAEVVELGPQPPVLAERWLVASVASLERRGYVQDDVWIAEPRSPRHVLNVAIDRCYAVIARGREGPRYMRAVDGEGRELTRGRGELRFCPQVATATLELDALAESAAVGLFSLRRAEGEATPGVAAAYSEFVAQGDPDAAWLAHLDARRPWVRPVSLERGCSELVAVASGSVAVRVSRADGTLVSRDSRRRASGGATATVHLCSDEPQELRVRVSVSEPGLVWVARRALGGDDS